MQDEDQWYGPCHLARRLFRQVKSVLPGDPVMLEGDVLGNGDRGNGKYRQTDH